MHDLQTLFNEANFHCLQKSGTPLVYIAFYKCASTYYRTLLLDNGWDFVDFHKINWSTTKVFSFICDPLVRYYKGLVQDLYNAEDSKLNDHVLETIKQYKKHVFILTDHNLPASIRFRGHAEEIDWIPIADGFPHHDLFMKLLNSYDLKVDPGENLDTHVAGFVKQQMYEEFRKAFGEPSDLFMMVFAADIDLFNKVKSKINLNASTWKQISWLCNSL